jgi:imidazole glycerol-phosphate synthase subunit HisH
MNKNATLIDMGYGNFPRLASFLKRLGYKITIQTINDSFQKSDLLIIPGIGNSNIINNINKKSDIYEYITSYEKHQNIILGICLGMQMMCMSSQESKNIFNGFNVFPYDVVILPNNLKQKVPRIGWYESSLTNKDQSNPIKLYYSHSYYVDSHSTKDICMLTNHGEKPIPAIIRNNNIIGFQFHPELSGDNGADIFQEIIR